MDRTSEAGYIRRTDPPTIFPGNPALEKEKDDEENTIVRAARGSSLYPSLRIGAKPLRTEREPRSAGHPGASAGG